MALKRSKSYVLPMLRSLSTKPAPIHPDTERMNILNDMKQYPKFIESCTLKDYREKWNHIPDGAREKDHEFFVAGRVLNKRKASSKLIFYDIKNEDSTLQVIATKLQYEATDSYSSINRLIRPGDIIGIRGFPGKSEKGELSIIPREITLLSPCIPPLPREWQTLSNDNIIYRQRYLDLLINDKSRLIFQKRTKILKYLRHFLDSRDFMEVETPVLSSSAGGATARPFVTRGKSIGEDLYMRISPELYLKQLVVGGFGRVYEVSRVFRNEGIDMKHNPEFTTIEAYRQYIDMNTWIKDTEDMISGLCKSLYNSLSLPYKDQIIDYTPPYKQMDIYTELKKHIPDLQDMNSQSSLPLLVHHCEENSIPITPPITLNRVLDELIHHYIEVTCQNPTFITGHPMVMSPLAHESPTRPGIAERFELFINQMEIVNAYTEQNSPHIQNEMFKLQAIEKEKGDDEIPPTDEDFVTALTYGLPPTSGWGMGVDRLVMLLTNAESIKDVILFPTLRHGISDTLQKEKNYK
ncbi:hypothetical protein WA158_004098 [Blastocystis sp. Blastoise]